MTTDILAVRLFNGRYMLDAGKVNYSFGGLHKVFEKTFEYLHLENFDFERILILGMGAGSIMSILTRRYGVQSAVTAVERDFTVIELGHKYFGMHQYTNLQLVNDDANEFVNHTTGVFDLILVDLFVEDHVPEIFASAAFLTSLRKISHENSIVVYNRITDTHVQKEETDTVYDLFCKFYPGAYKLRFKDHYAENTLIISNTALPSGRSSVRESLHQNYSINIPGYS